MCVKGEGKCMCVESEGVCVEVSGYAHGCSRKALTFSKVQSAYVHV